MQVKEYVMSGAQKAAIFVLGFISNVTALISLIGATEKGIEWRGGLGALAEFYNKNVRESIIAAIESLEITDVPYWLPDYLVICTIFFLSLNVSFILLYRRTLLGWAIENYLSSDTARENYGVFERTLYYIGCPISILVQGTLLFLFAPFLIVICLAYFTSPVWVVLLLLNRSVEFYLWAGGIIFILVTLFIILISKLDDIKPVQAAYNMVGFIAKMIKTFAKHPIKNSWVLAAFLLGQMTDDTEMMELSKLAFWQVIYAGVVLVIFVALIVANRSI